MNLIFVSIFFNLQELKSFIVLLPDDTFAIASMEIEIWNGNVVVDIQCH